jgi:hypothetical protein
MILLRRKIGKTIGVFLCAGLLLTLAGSCKKSGTGAALQMATDLQAKDGAKTSSVIWTGDVQYGAAAEFYNVGSGNVETGASISSYNDATRGTVWRFHKPVGSNRCENHGIKNGSSKITFQNNTTYYFGWWTKLTNNSDNNAIFQWKSYDEHSQNFPLTLKLRGGKLVLQYTAPGVVSTIIWESAFNANTWYKIALGIRVDNGNNEGWVELWYNGTKQTFKNGSQRYYGRTLDDGGHNCPKWGIYGRSDLSITNYMDDLKMGTAYSDVD